VGGGEGWTCAPEETNETVLKVTCDGDDGIERVAPDDEDAFIADEGSVLVLFCLRKKDH
jgi:hypothetical protein